MSTNVDFSDLLDKKYPSYTSEVNAFLDSCQISSSVEVSVAYIYPKIRNDTNVDSNLKLLYDEAINGNDKDVKKRIYNRNTHFRRTLRSVHFCVIIAIAI